MKDISKWTLIVGVLQVFATVFFLRSAVGEGLPWLLVGVLLLASVILSLVSFNSNDKTKRDEIITKIGLFLGLLPLILILIGLFLFNGSLAPGL